MSDKSDTKKKKEAMVQALESTAGIVTQACERADISRDTHYRWYRTDVGYRMAVDDVQNVGLDLAESKLLEQIKDGNTTAIIFFLKTKGKKRGYSQNISAQLYYERQSSKELEGIEDINFDNLTESEYEELAELLDKVHNDDTDTP